MVELNHERRTHIPFTSIGQIAHKLSHKLAKRRARREGSIRVVVGGTVHPIKESADATNEDDRERRESDDKTKSFKHGQSPTRY